MGENDIARLHALVEGRVQGVGFRFFVLDTAETLGVTGWVRNLPDGRVESVFEGSDPAVQAMLAWCRRGTPPARVDRVEAVEEPPSGEYSDFAIV